MSQHRLGSQDLADTPSRLFGGGATRASGNPRLHAISRPYSRPASYTGPSPSASSSSLAQNGGLDFGSGPGSLGFNRLSSGVTHHNGRAQTQQRQQPFSTSRPLPHSISTSTMSSGMTRSGSLPSLSTTAAGGGSAGLFSGIKSIFSRPLQWLATPSKGTTKREQDVEDQESPVVTLRRNHTIANGSAAMADTNGDYAPARGGSPALRGSSSGRGVSGQMLPPLPPNVSLSARNRSNSTLTTNFSRPLHSVRSLPHLDPPLASPSNSRTSGVLTRSRRANLRSDDEEEEMDDGDHDMGQVTENGRSGEAWSPWKDRQRQVQASPRSTRGATGRSTTPNRRASVVAVREHTLPSISPFKPTRSPSQRVSASGLSRSNTTANTTTFARAGSAMSDVSMGRESGRSGHTSRRPVSTLFGQQHAVAEENMSVDGDKPVTPRMGWFAKERWEGEPGSPSARSGVQSLASPHRHQGPQIRRGQLVWDSEKGFVREDELHDKRGSKLIGKNEAEKILFALETSRSTPLRTAQSTIVPGGAIPPELIGASSRTLRKAISVPLATAMAGDTARGRREKERLEDKARGMSAMISPYGRRRQVDDADRERRRERREQDEGGFSASCFTGSTDGPAEYRRSEIPRSSEQPSERSRSSRGGSDYDMRSESEAELSPAPTPRRSSRLKRRDATSDAETTPKSRKTGKGKAAGESARNARQDSPSKSTRRSKKKHAERTNSPAPPQADKTVPPVPSVPTITETAPSPDAKSTSTSTYQPRADGDYGREGSSLRAKSSISKRTHGASASLSNSRATSPTSSGRYSAREEDLPPMEELEAPKIPFNSFSGISFANLESSQSQPPKPAAAETSSAPSTSATNAAASSGSSLLGRLGPAPSSKSDSNNSLNVPHRMSSGPLSRINSSRPRASSPLASGSIVAIPESPPTEPAKTEPPKPSEPPSGGFFRLGGAEPPKSTTPSKPPPASLFAGIGSGSDAPKKSLGSGLGKPASQPTPPSEPATTNGEVPDFFGKKSQPNSGSTTPTGSGQSFNFGISSQPAKPAETAPAATTSKPFSFGSSVPTGATEAKTNGTTSGFSFGQSKPAESQPKADTSGLTPAQDAPKSTFQFGGSSSSTPAPASDAGTKPPVFGFGQSSTSNPGTTREPPKAAEPPKPFTGFSFGQSSGSTPTSTAEPAKSSGFLFGKPNGDATASAPAPASTGFSFGKPAEVNGTKETPRSTGFSFGSSTTEKKPGDAPAKTSTPFTFGGAPSSNSAFGSTPAATPAANGTSSFSFGKPAEAKPAGDANKSTTFGSGSTSSPFGNSNGTSEAPKSNPFGGSGGSSNTLGSFGSGGASTQPTSANGAAPSNPFGQSNSTSASTGFNFGAPSTVSSTPASNPFGSSQSSAPASNPNPFGGGSTATPPSNPFGSAPTAAAASPSGGSFNFNFSAQSPSQAPNGAAAPSPSTSFTFGQQQPNPSTPSGPSPAFTFGSGTQNPTPQSTGSQPGFTFGGGAGASNTSTPQSSGQPFVFGGGAGGGGAGSGAPQRFGSPAPATPDGGAGGFSMGAAGDVPGSPSGRRIKPLRRSAVKR